MINLQKLLKWSYGFERRHIALLATGLIYALQLTLVNVVGNSPHLLNILAFTFPIVGIIALRQASLEELKTLSTWALIIIVASGIVRFSVKQAVNPNLTVDTFTNTTLVGGAIAVPAAVAMVFLLIASIPTVAKLMDHRLVGGSGGSPSSPEEKVLTESEFEDFDPIEESKALFGALHGEISG
jgi:hypothetical protein